MKWYKGQNRWQFLQQDWSSSSTRLYSVQFSTMMTSVKLFFWVSTLSRNEILCFFCLLSMTVLNRSVLTSNKLMSNLNLSISWLLPLWLAKEPFYFPVSISPAPSRTPSWTIWCLKSSSALQEGSSSGSSRSWTTRFEAVIAQANSASQVYSKQNNNHFFFPNSASWFRSRYLLISCKFLKISLLSTCINYSISSSSFLNGIVLALLNFSFDATS
jgi:hypothetical protein